jgi:hypothetical protein
MRHLDAELYRQILEQPAQVPLEVYPHLREDCPECAAFLASLAPEQRDQRIHRLLREPDAPALPAFSLVPGDGRGPKLLLVVGAILGLLLVAGGAEAFLIRRAKAGPRAVMPEVPPIRISVKVLYPDAGEAPARQDEELTRHERLLAEAQLSRDAYVSLVRGGDNAGFDPLLLNQRAKTATVEFEGDGGPLIVPLDSLSGSQHLLVLSCDRPIAIDEAISAAKGILPAGLGMAVYDFRVAE